MGFDLHGGLLRAVYHFPELQLAGRLFVMAGRWFAQIDCSLLQSKKFTDLSGAAPKFAYICVHLSVFGNYSGIYQYPISAFAHDVGVNEIELKAIILELTNSQLIEYDYDEEIVRIVGWHRQVTGSANASMARSRISDYRREKIPFGPMLFRSIAEFSAAVVKSSLDWNPEKNESIKLREKLGPFLREIFEEAGSELLDAISAETRSQSSATARELTGLLPPLAEHNASTMPPRCPHRIGDERIPIPKEKEKKEKVEDPSENIAKQTAQTRHKKNETKPSEEIKKQKMNRSSIAGPLEETKNSALVTGTKPTR